MITIKQLIMKITNKEYCVYRDHKGFRFPDQPKPA